LTFINDGNPDFLPPPSSSLAATPSQVPPDTDKKEATEDTVTDKGESPKLINFTKCDMLAKIIGQVRRFQRTPYNLIGVEFMQEFLLNTATLSEDMAYRQSLMREGRESNSNIRDRRPQSQQSGGNSKSDRFKRRKSIAAVNLSDLLSDDG
jgi:hypothetical protein